LAKVKAKLDADAALPDYTPPTPTPAPSESSEPTPAPSESGAGTESTGLTPLRAGSTAISGGVSLTGDIPAEYQQYPENGSVWALYNKAVSECESLSFGGATAAMAAANERAMRDVTDICAVFGIVITEDYWHVHYENSSNEVPVDFR
jgi:hypothetical protein